MAMTMHVLFNQANHYKGGGNVEYKNLMTPFNQEEVQQISETEMTKNPYFKECLYRCYVNKNTKMNYMGGVTRSISRLAMPDIYDKDELTGYGGYGWDEAGNFYAEYWDGTAQTFNTKYLNNNEIDFSQEQRIVMKIDAITKELSATIIDSFGQHYNYAIWSNSQQTSGRHSSSAAMFCLMAYVIAAYEKGILANNTEAKVLYDHFSDIIKYHMEEPHIMKFAAATRVFTNDFYTLIQYNHKGTCKQCLDADLYNKDIIPALDLSTLPTLTEFKGDSAIFGKVQKSAPTKMRLSRSGPKKVKEYGLEYSLCVAFADAEESYIPKGYGDFVPNPIILDVAREIKLSSNDPIPCRNLLFTGETGTGKTTSMKMLAQLLQVPYYSMNLSGDKTSSDILVNCLPNHQKLTYEDLLAQEKKFPDAGTILMNPEYAYKMVTGKDKGDATEQDVVEAMTKVRLDLLNRTSDFMYVDSPFVQAFRNGGIVELQECNSTKASVLKALNECLDDSNILHLPTGEVVKRNPNCIVAVTANINYEGTNEFSNDFIARFHQADIFELPSDKDLCKQAMLVTGYQEEKIILKMIRVMKAMQKVLMETKGDSGSCSPRGLYAWCRKTKNSEDGDPYKAALSTIIALSSQDKDIIAELKSALETEFSPKR